MKEYAEGTRVEFTVDGDVSILQTGRVCGLIYEGIVPTYVVLPDVWIEGWPYSTICVRNSFMRPVGESRPFGCEGQR